MAKRAWAARRGRMKPKAILLGDGELGRFGEGKAGDEELGNVLLNVEEEGGVE